MAIVLFAFCSGSLAANWQSTVSKDPPGDFPGLRPLHATYRFGWSGLTAATGEVDLTKTFDDKFQLVVAFTALSSIRPLMLILLLSQWLAGKKSRCAAAVTTH